MAKQEQHETGFSELLTRVKGGDYTGINRPVRRGGIFDGRRSNRTFRDQLAHELVELGEVDSTSEASSGTKDIIKGTTDGVASQGAIGFEVTKGTKGTEQIDIFIPGIVKFNIHVPPRGNVRVSNNLET